VTDAAQRDVALDLDQQRDAIELLGAVLGAWWRHLPVFLVLAALVVVPIDVLLRALPGEAAAPAQLFAGWVVVPALVTALHVLAVQDLGAGRRPSIRRSVAGTARVALPVALVVVLYGVGVAVGLVLLVAPGIFLAVHWYFSAQVVVVEGLRGRAALRRSGAIVAHRWGRAFALLLLFGFVPAFVLAAVAALADAVPGLGGAGRDAALIAADCAALSFSALGGTLLFFDLLARD